MKNYFGSFLKPFILLLFFVTQFTYSQNSNNLPAIKLGIISDGSWEDERAISELFKKEIYKLFEGEYDIQISQDKVIDGGFDIQKIHSGFLQIINDDEVDIVIAGGEIASRIAIFSKNLPKPTIATIVYNAEYQNMPIVNGTSGVKNLNYITLTSAFQEEIKTFKKLVDFKKATLLVNKLFLESLEDESIKLEAISDKTIDGIRYNVVPIGADIERAFSLIPEDSEAIILGSLHNLSGAKLQEIAEYFNKRQMPVFSLFDQRPVNNGILMSSFPKNFLQRLMRRIALNIQSILMGEAPEDLPVKFPFESEYVINMETAKKLKLYPSWNLMAQSKLINTDKEPAKRSLSFFQAIGEAMELNLNLLSKEKELLAGKEDIRIARSNLLPQLGISASGIQIDKDRAEGSSGQQAERTITGTATLSQLLYDEKAWANLDISEIQQKILEYENTQTRLDVVLAVATAYLNVLQAKANEVILIDNLNNSLSNLEIAQYRNEVGTACAAEIYRWQSEIASNRKAVIDANVQRNISEMELNKLLNRPLEESFETEEIRLQELVDNIKKSPIIKYYENKWYFKIFRKFMVEEAFIYSPELKIIDAGVSVQERALTSANNSLFLPSIALQAELNNTLYRGGAGTTIEPTEIPGIGSITFGSIPEDVSWNVGLNLSLPLYSGGSRYAEIAQSIYTLSKLKIDRELVKDNIEQQVRTSVHYSGSSFAGMREAADAEEAAKKNLEIIVDSYSQGAISITDLIDAQNAALSANLNVINAKYAFLIDLINVQTAIGRFMDLISKDERNNFYTRLDEYFNKEINK